LGPTRLGALSKPVIAAIEGPAVAGGMELAFWADCRVMAEGSYTGIHNRRWAYGQAMRARLGSRILAGARMVRPFGLAKRRASA